MAKKRKDQRFGIDGSVERQVFSLLDQKSVQKLIKLRADLEKQIEIVESEIRSAPTDLFAQTLSRSTGRRGEARLEVDPDGKTVLVVSYGGEPCQPLSRTALAPAWTKRNERKKKPVKADEPSAVKVEHLPDEDPTPPKKKGGFMKTSVAVSETKMLDLDSLLDNFDEDNPDLDDVPEVDLTEAVVYENAYTPTKKKIRRIPGQRVDKGSNGKSKLSDLSKQSLDVIESSNGEAE